jgi:hypothetical protein
MIYIGKHVMSQVLCTDCGEPITNCMDGNKSFFIIGSCQNKECDSYAVNMTIERASMQIIAIDFIPSSSGGKRIYAVVADKDGNQVWPKEKE